MADTADRLADREEKTPGPRITVHVPCYNYGRFLGDALESLLLQSLTAWEAVVIDDASTDETAVVLDRYRDPRIRVLRHPVRRGHVSTYNEGIELATGEYFVILSADDRYKPAFLERIVAFFDAHPEVVLATSHGDRIDDHGRVFQAELAPFDRTGVYDALPLLFQRTFVAASAGVTRTANIRALGGYDPAFDHSCDAYLWRQLAISGAVGYVHEPLYERRFHGGSMSHNVRRSQVLEAEHTTQLARIFGRNDLPARVRELKSHAYSELHWKIAHAYFAERRWGRTLAHAASALRFNRRVVARHMAARALRRFRRFRRGGRRTPDDAVVGERLCKASVFVHETALCESSDVGDGTTIWAFAHVMPGARLGVACKVGDHVFVETGAVIGDRVTIKNGTLIWDGILIEDDVFVGPGVVFTNDLVPRANITKGRDQLRTTRVRYGASVGANATIVCGTMIGPHAMIGAASVVTQDVPAHALVVGNPASQVAWVCDCGLRLGNDLRCRCDKRYRLTDGAGGIEPVRP